jgi:hypothetical protein
MAGEVSGGNAPNEKCTSSATSRQGTQGIVSVRSKVVGAAAGADQCAVAPAVDLSRLWRRGEEPSPRSLPGLGSPVPDQTVRNAWSGAGPSCTAPGRRVSWSSGPRGQPRPECSALAASRLSVSLQPNRAGCVLTEQRTLPDVAPKHRRALVPRLFGDDALGDADSSSRGRKTSPQ